MYSPTDLLRESGIMVSEKSSFRLVSTLVLLMGVPLGAVAGETVRSLQATIPAPEATRREAFVKKYQDIVSDERMKALDLLRRPSEEDTLWTLFVVSYWDHEPRVRMKAYRMLTRAKDPLGYVTQLAAQSYRLELCGELKAQKADILGSMQYRGIALKELCESMIHLQSPREGETYGPAGMVGHRLRGCAHTDCLKQLRFGSRWAGYRGGHHHGGRVVGFGGRRIGTGGSYDDYWDDGTAKDNRDRINRILGAINTLGSARFKLRYGFERRVKEWWALKEPEFKEMDRRLRAKVEEQLADDDELREEAGRGRRAVAKAASPFAGLDAVGAGKDELRKLLQEGGGRKQAAKQAKEVAAPKPKPEPAVLQSVDLEADEEDDEGL